jgi:hypothetical protein
MSALRDLLYILRSPISAGYFEEKERGGGCRQLCASREIVFRLTKLGGVGP